ncbi:MAG: phosphoadenosine phosphosulfate reductase, partial [Alcaligenaceae bacterium]|nr:phosphoadenosine phosphosulfate reductase [Alcaligenaceae bacterium]
MFSPQLWQAPVVSKATFSQLPTLEEELEQHLRYIADKHKDVRFASSLAVEDMVITDAIARLKLPIKVFTLSTGKLHQETLELLEETRQR